MKPDDEESLLRSVATQNARIIFTARQRAENALEHSLSLMRATLESTTDAILATDAEGKVTGFNEKFVLMWKVPRHIMESRDHHQIQAIVEGQFRDPLQFTNRIAEIYATSATESYDLLEPMDGRSIERFSSMQVVNGRTAGRVWSFRDVTERNRLLENERSASALKDEFLATLSHELRTPLNAILGWSQVIRRGARNEEVLNEGLETIEHNARLQIQLIEDLIDMSRITAGKMRLDIRQMKPVLVVHAAIETLRPAADAKGVHIETLVAVEAGSIWGDPSRLHQVVSNLLSNAIKFTPRDGRVQVFLKRAESHIEICVADSGIGIKREFLPHVFERFRQAEESPMKNYGGLGLGLSIVKNLVELHGGTVHVESSGEGAGARFRVRLPLTTVRS